MTPFLSPYRHDFIRVAACVPTGAVADPAVAVAETLALLRQGDAARVGLMVFPELGLSAYAIDDLLFQDALLDRVVVAVAELVAASASLFPAFVVGAPLRVDGALYNCAIAIHAGRVLGVVPKTFLPNYREFYEERHCTSGAGVRNRSLRLAGQEVPFGVDLLFRSTGSAAFCFHIEICEDVWVPLPPSTLGALAGAEILLNLSASNITIGKADTRRALCGSQSERAIAAYAYSAAGPGESTTDLAWDGQAAIFELGAMLAETERFPTAPGMAVADVDVGRIRQERMRVGTFADCARGVPADQLAFRTVAFALNAPAETLALCRNVARFPYVPNDASRLAQDCYEAYNIQVQGLAKRITAARAQRLVIGISGGLDSTQALLVAVRAMDRLGRPRSDIMAFTLPGFATTDGTKSNAWALMRALGVTAAEIDIRPAARMMLADIGHPYADGAKQYDITFENVQAGLRTDYLFRLANHHNGLVVGTGDLSELGLGWCTYGVGDHMSHYNVNASVSKTLIQHLIRFVAASGELGQAASEILLAILETEISPELVPPDASGAIQSTEASVGPYPLQDFNLFYTTRYGFRPSKIAYLAWSAWHDAAAGEWPPNTPADKRVGYDLATIRKWLRGFLHRFFATSQFKRSVAPNGPKISSGGSLSPRGDWRAPSDGNANVWIAELEAHVPEQI